MQISALLWKKRQLKWIFRWEITKNLTAPKNVWTFFSFRNLFLKNRQCHFSHHLTKTFSKQKPESFIHIFCVAAAIKFSEYFQFSVLEFMWVCDLHGYSLTWSRWRIAELKNTTAIYTDRLGPREFILRCMLIKMFFLAILYQRDGNWAHLRAKRFFLFKCGQLYYTHIIWNIFKSFHIRMAYGV